jgi:S1-C subfamily serine protease
LFFLNAPPVVAYYAAAEYRNRSAPEHLKPSDAVFTIAFNIWLIMIEDVANPFEHNEKSQPGGKSEPLLQFEDRWQPPDRQQPAQKGADVRQEPKPSTGSTTPDWLKKPFHLPNGGRQAPSWQQLPEIRPLPDVLPAPEQRPAPGWRPSLPSLPFETPSSQLPINRDTTAPTLYYAKKADELDNTKYQPTDAAYKVYEQARDSIVRIQVHQFDSLGKERSNYSGSGFFVSQDGKIATAYHVIAGKNPDDTLTVDLADGRTLKATIAEVKPLSDIAVLQVEHAPNETFKALDLRATSRDIKENIPVFVVGHPLGWGRTYVSEGTLLGRDRIHDTDLVHDPNNQNRMVLHAQIHVEKGNSGSPMLDKDGRVIGVVSFGDSGWNGYSDSVEDLNSLLGKARPSDYWPNAAVFGRTTVRDGLTTTADALNLTANIFARNSRGAAMVRGGTAWLNASLAYNDLTSSDWSAFKSSWDKGTTAERFTSTLNVGADLSMLGGSAALLFGGSKFRTAASIIVGTGAMTKFLNGLGSDRAY